MYHAIMQSKCNEGPQVTDNTANDSQEYSFLDEKPFHERTGSLFYYLVKIYKLASVDLHSMLC